MCGRSVFRSSLDLSRISNAWVWDSSKHTVFQIHLCPIETLGDLMSWMLNACLISITWDEMHKITVTIYVSVIESAKSHPDTGVSARSPWRNTKSLDSGPRFLLHVLSSVAISCHVWQCVYGIFLTIFGHNTWGPAQYHLPKSNNSGRLMSVMGLPSKTNSLSSGCVHRRTTSNDELIWACICMYVYMYCHMSYVSF